MKHFLCVRSGVKLGLKIYIWTSFIKLSHPFFTPQTKHTLSVTITSYYLSVEKILFLTCTCMHVYFLQFFKSFFRVLRSALILALYISILIPCILILGIIRIWDFILYNFCSEYWPPCFTKPNTIEIPHLLTSNFIITWATPIKN